MTKINVISGFLGAGKTTLIAKLIKDVFPGEQVVLVENEFGQIGIDGGFLKDAGIEIKEINSGCICCTLKGDFEAALSMVVEQYHPDRIVIEPSGVGKLSDILKAIQTVEGLEIDSYSTVVDAKRCAVYHKNFKEFFDDQIATANCVILSRTQNVSEAELQADIDIIRELNPEARIITTPWDELDGRTMFEAMTGVTDGFPKDLEEEETCSCGCGHHHHHGHEEEECCCGHHHDEEHHECGCHHEHEHEHECHHEHEHEEGECCCGHHHDEEHHECECHHEHEHEHECHHQQKDVNEGLSEGNRIYIGEGEEHENHHHHHHHDADEVFDSIGIETINRYTRAELETALSQLGDNIIRAKGIVPAKDEEGWLFFDYVPGDADIRSGSPAYTGLITVIGEKVDIEMIKKLFGVK